MLQLWNRIFKGGEEMKENKKCEHKSVYPYKLILLTKHLYAITIMKCSNCYENIDYDWGEVYCFNKQNGVSFVNQEMFIKTNYVNRVMKSKQIFGRLMFKMKYPILLDGKNSMEFLIGYVELFKPKLLKNKKFKLITSFIIDGKGNSEIIDFNLEVL